jgi:hypothetical protein
LSWGFNCAPIKFLEHDHYPIRRRSFRWNVIY